MFCSSNTSLSQTIWYRQLIQQTQSLWTRARRRLSSCNFICHARWRSTLQTGSEMYPLQRTIHTTSTLASAPSSLNPSISALSSSSTSSTAVSSSSAPTAVASSPSPPEVAPLPPPTRLSPDSSTWLAYSSSQLGPPGRIMIYASEVAGIVGMNPYKPMYEIFERVWARTEPELYQKRLEQAEQELGYKLLTRDQEAMMLLETPAGSALQMKLTHVLDHVQEFSYEDLEREKKALKTLAQTSLKAKITESQLSLLCEYLIGEVSKAYGIKNEERALKAYELVADLTVIDNNRVFYGREIGECVVKEAESKSSTESNPSSNDSTTPFPFRRSFWIGGRVDGFSSVSGHLIEMKNRTKKFLTPLPLYDRCQMECYLQVCNVEEGELVERLRKKVNTEQAKKEQLRLQAMDKLRREMEAELDQIQELSISASEQVDVEFLQSTEIFSQSTPIKMSSELTDSVNPSTTAVEDDLVDHEFLADTRPLQPPDELTYDASFMNSTSTPSSTNLAPTAVSSTSNGSFISSTDVTAPSAPPSLGIFGTQHLTDSQTITHILTRETSNVSNEDEEYPNDRRMRTPTPSTASDASDVLSKTITSHLVQSFLDAAQPEIINDTAQSDSNLYIDQIKRTPLKRDDHHWRSEILPGLTTFAHFLTRFLTNPNLQLTYLKCTTEEAKHTILGEIIPTPKMNKRTYGYKKGTSGKKKKEIQPEPVDRINTS